MTTLNPAMVSIIIVNWNGRHHLPDCLDSLAQQNYRHFEVVLVDNGSVDGSIELLREHYPWVKVVPLGENTGFAHGNNVGWEHSTGDYIVALNNDTKADPDWLRQLVKVADDHPAVGLVGSRICAFDQPDTIDSLGVRICTDGMSRGAYRRQSYSSLALSGTMEVLLPSACAALYRRSMLEEVGFFDADFFAYCEDTDLGLRCRLAGWNALLALEAVVLHKYSGTGGVFSPFKIYLVERNHYWAAIKNFPLGALLVLPFATGQRFLVQGWGVLTGQGSGGDFVAGTAKMAIIAAILKGTWHALAALPTVWRKRRAMQSKRRLSHGQQTALLKRYNMSFRSLLDICSEAP